ncbi:hypothetical protein HP15_62 [Marinobacter adhaerens HP15]|uniref:Uncharacterized protein n=1 Tax=Marinobacter adhaerens (strain DSM 23420 / HP15) TaxID=225937 RepID=E4PIC1_MARAH|nr:hypothetical protein HP15_62 [Marinobacter adhaerens HP15]
MLLLQLVGYAENTTEVTNILTEDENIGIPLKHHI